jgi:predicted anti-sigma-YlaC factor YlaD
MNCRTCQPLLSAHLDGTLPAVELAAVEVHLRECAACRAISDDLKSITDTAASLDMLTPPPHVWHQIAAAAQPRRSGFQPGWFGWQPLTAMAMTAAIAAGLWRVGTLLHPAETSAPQVTEVAVADPTSDPEAHYTIAIARLEEVTSADRDVLDSQTADVIDAGLMVIDDAITESRAALQSQPQSESAQESLFAALRRKVALLQEMLALINEMRKGNPEGTARILSEINR